MMIETQPFPIVTVLCASKWSVYHRLSGIDVWTKDRNATNYRGQGPVIAHPPCRAWSRFVRHQAQPEPGEKDVGIFCAETVKNNGGILEHPAHSHLWDAAHLPQPGNLANPELFTLAVWQTWWHYPLRKGTWLLFSKIDKDKIHFPFRLHNRGADRRRQQLMSHQQRSETTLQFATWLLELARTAGSTTPSAT